MNTTAKKHGMLMTKANAEKCFKGIKTVTRRLIPDADQYGKGWKLLERTNRKGNRVWYPEKNGAGVLENFKPKYKPGDIVAIKETHWRWGYKEKNAKGNWCFVPSHCGNAEDVLFYDPQTEIKTKPYNSYHSISSLFLPYDYARTYWEILSVRPERLQDITPEDCWLEGILKWGNGNNQPINALWDFEQLWDSINPKHPFSSNPWVWRYERKATT